MRQNSPFIILVISFMLAVAIVYPTTCTGEALEFTAFSFRTAEKILTSTDLKNTSDEVFQLGYVTKPVAIVVDRKGNDLILVGIKDKNFPFLSLDDFVTALRCSYFYGIPPGVTIEPKEKGNLQDVRYFCGIENTHFGKVCYESDYLLKKIAFEKEQIDVPIKSYYQLAVDRFKNNSSLTWNTASRFWFYLLEGGSQVSDNVAYLLPETRIGVLSKTLVAEENGQPIGNVSEYSDIPAIEFTQAFSLQFREVGRAKKIFAELQNLYKITALSKGLMQISDIPDLGYWLLRYRTKDIGTPSITGIITASYSDGRRKMNLSGGVQIASITFKLKKQQFSALAGAALISRPSLDSLTWSFTLQKDYSLSFPSLTEEERSLAKLFTQGLLFYQMRSYNSALEYFEKVLTVNPDVSEAWMIKGMILRDWGLSNYNEKRVLSALDCFKKAVDLNSSVVSVHNEFGKTLHAIGKTDDSVSAFKRAIEIRPDYAPSYYGLGLALKTKRDFSGAITAFEKYLQYNTSQENIEKAKSMIAGLELETKATENKEASSQNIYSNSQHKFSCQYSRNWAKNSREELIKKGKERFNPPDDLVVAFVSPDNFDDNVNIQVAQVDEDNLSDKDIEETIQELDKAYPKNYTNFRKIKAGTVSVDGAKGFEYIYTYTRFEVPLQQKVIIFVKAKRAYTLTFTALRDHFGKLDNLTFQLLLNTFRIQ